MQKRIFAFLSEHKKALLFAAFLACLYFRGIGDHGLLDPLEGLTASVGLDMAVTGRYFSPHIGEAACAGTSLGTWWLSALAVRLLGWREFAVRFWPALSGLLLALASALAVKREGVGRWLAAAICASTTACFAVSQLASSHALYACCTAFAMTAMVRVIQGEREPQALSQRRWIWAWVLATTAAFIVRGPEGLLLPCVALAIFVAATGRLDLTAGMGFSLLGAGLWLLLLWLANPLILRFMLFRTPQFLPASFVFAAFIPWPGFMLRALWDVRRGAQPLSHERLFLTVWALAFALGAFLDVLNLAACVPPLAALTGDWLGERVEERKPAEVQQAVALNILILLPLAAIGLPLAPDALLSLIPWGIFLAVFTFATWHYARTRQLTKLARNASAVALLCLLPLTGVFDLLAESGAIRNVGSTLHRVIQRGDVLVQYGANRPSLYFYTLTPYATVNGPLLPGVKKFELTDTALHLLWDGKDRAFLLIPQDQQPRQPLPNDVYNIDQADGMTLLSNKPL